MAVVKKRITFVIPEEMLLEPILYAVTQQYDLKVNVYNSDLIGNEGVMKLELEGEEKQIEEGLAWAMTRGFASRLSVKKHKIIIYISLKGA